MILTTTQSSEGHKIIEYRGLVFGEVISGVNAFKDIAASWRNIVGGRTNAYEGELNKARNQAIQEMVNMAGQYGANAIVGVKLDYETLGEGGSMLMVTASGTGVVIA